ncbi:hypothetical protein BJ741DRAFT_603064 [Chytriomyces cf. hyalinus JEL632]|nr:hypothetical protein BJ741DRAFT_603064 [Chytriomyces cf. hyalinus JEL632]
MATFIALASVASIASAQFQLGGPTQPGLPPGCLGSFPDIKKCAASNWFLTEADPCYPVAPIPLDGQKVYVKDATNFCINLPDPDSIFLQENFYKVGANPTFVQSEGYVRSFCMGDYLPPGAKRMPQFGLRSVRVVKNFTAVGSMYMQVSGVMDCKTLNINCTQSAPGLYDDGGQYDNVGFSTCGKEPYSGVDNTDRGNPGFVNYLEMGGNGVFCMRVCEAGTMGPGGVCDVTRDTAGCQDVMAVSFTDPDGAFIYQDSPTAVATTQYLSLPPLPTTTTTTTTVATTNTAPLNDVTAVPGAPQSGSSVGVQTVGAQPGASNAKSSSMISAQVGGSVLSLIISLIL